MADRGDFRHPWVLAGALGCALSCDAVPSPGVRFELSNDTSVWITDDDQVIVFDGDGRELVMFPTGPVARTFVETWSGETAIYKFERGDESSVAFDTLVQGTHDGNAVRIQYDTADGSASAMLHIEAGADGEIGLRWEADGEYQSLAVPTGCREGASFLGFGEQYNAADQRGQKFDLIVGEQGIGRDPDAPKLGLNGDAHTTYFPMPYFLDLRGFGVLFDTAARTRVDLCKSDAEAAWFEVVDGAPVSASLFRGPTPADVVQQLGARVGRPARPPDWAFRPWIGAQGGTAAVTAELDALDAAQIPYGVLWVQDWTGPRQNFDGGWGVQYRWREDLGHYPGLVDLVADTHARGARFLAYVNPFVTPSLEHFDEMDANGWLVRDPMGETYRHIAPNGLSAHPDLTDPGAREYVKGELSRIVTELGMDGWMADFGEWLPLDAETDGGGDPIQEHNRYPIEWHRLSREVMDAVRPDGDWAVFARSGFTGVQAVSQIHWVGDQEASFSPHDGLPTVVPAMLNLGLSGVPFVTHDIAGFSGGPSTKELWMRWAELGAFTPVMRTHEGNNKEENWSWEKDAETTEHFRRFARIHEALIPELTALADEAAATSLPMVRHLALAFPEDADSRGVDDQYMLGDALLVAPVVTEGQTSRDVYLPPGSWFHLWTGDAYEGGQTVTVDAPLGSPPVFSLSEDRADLRAIE